LIRKYQADPEKLALYHKMRDIREKEIAEAKMSGIDPPKYPYELKEPRVKQIIKIEHIDIIKDDFWSDNLGQEILKN